MYDDQTRKFKRMHFEMERKNLDEKVLRYRALQFVPFNGKKVYVANQAPTNNDYVNDIAKSWFTGKAQSK